MDLMHLDWLGTPLWMWLAFLAAIAALLVLDLGLLHRRDREIETRESLALSGFYIALGLAFGAWVWWLKGTEAGIAYVTGYAVEKALAMDNVFVIATIFGALAVPRRYQHRVLFWGIIGVIVLRGIMIGAGSVLVARFDWIMHVFAGLLILTGIKMWRSSPETQNPAGSPMLAWIRRRLRVTDSLDGPHFFVRRSDPAGRTAWHATPLLLALILVEFVDVIFAVDSVPAIFAITTDPYIVYTSNIMAILGLRALYFALAAMVARFHYLKYALSLLLVFIGAKMFLADALGLAKIPPALSLAITAAILAGGIAWSLWKTRPARAEGREIEADSRR